jgi:hypothetical protein
MDIENYLFGSNIIGIISQRLVKKLCPACKEKKKASEYEKTVIKKLLNKDIEDLYYPKGCQECQNGYVGQTPIVEVIEITDEIKSAITNKKERKVIRNLLYQNNDTILVDGFNKAISGETTFNEIIRIIDVKADLTEEQNDIKEYILGNGAPTTATTLNNTAQATTTVTTKEQPTTPAKTNEVQKEEPPKVETPQPEPKVETQPVKTEEKTTVVPAPIEASIVEDTPANVAAILEEDDDDDFDYSGYENSF